MIRPRIAPRSSSPSPVRIFAIVLTSVFLVEISIMLVGLWKSSPMSWRSFGTALLDAIVLTVVISPMLWIVVVRPLRSLHRQRGELLLRILATQEQERARISRDLHDEVGQLLTGILLSLRAAENAPTPEAQRDGVACARALASRGLEEVRRLARGLSPVVLKDFGLRTAVERLCQDISKSTAISITTAIELPEAPLNLAAETAAYRVLQEALTNAAKHSSATRISVLVRLEGDALLLEVSDDGRGLAPEADGRGLGLHGMRERVSLLGGRFSIGPRRGGGTTMTAFIPGVLEPHEPDDSPHRG